jgi:integrase
MAKNATTAIFIDKYHPQKDGTCAVSMRVTYQRKKKYYPTIFSLSLTDFEKVKAAERPKEDIKRLRQQLQALEKKASDIIRELPYFTWESFERQFLLNRGNRNSLKTAFDEYIMKLREEGRVGTAVSYECARNSLGNFKFDAVFLDVTPAFLSRYEKWMLDSKNSVTTIGIYLRSLRTLLNLAIEEGLISKELYPFGKRRYEIPSSNNVKKALSLSEIALIYKYKPMEGSNAERMKDYWLFMYYCNGINVKDMCLLKYKNLQGDMLAFERAKTARTKRKVEPIRVVLLEEAKAIIEKWGNKQQSKETFVFPVLSPSLSPDRERQLIQQLTHVINDNMRTIAATLGIEGEVTTYAARHSFATVLKRSGASTEFISEALGHSNVKTTQNYLASFEDERKKEMAKALTAFG